MENNYGDIDSNLEKETHGVPKIPTFLHFKSSVIRLGYTEAIIYGILCAYGKGELGYCNLRNQSIADMIDRSVRVVSDAISKLDKNGFIKVHLNISEKGTYRTITISGLAIEENSQEGSGKLLTGRKNTSIQKNYKDNSKDKEWKNDHPLKDWIIQKEFLSVMKLKEPTPKQCDDVIKLLTDYGISINNAKIKVAEIVENMENKKDLTKSYSVFHLTCTNWIKLRLNEGKYDSLLNNSGTKHSPLQGTIN